MAAPATSGPPVTVRRLLLAATVAAAAVVFLHVATCAVTHGVAVAAMPADADHRAGEHLPEAVAAPATAALVMTAIASVVLLHARRDVIPVAMTSAAPGRLEAPPGDPPSERSAPSSLCVFRC